MYEGRVRAESDFGVFVDLGVGIVGLVHKSQIPGLGSTQAKFLASPGDSQRGQVVKVRVLKVDAETRKVSLSMRLVPGVKSHQIKGFDLSK